jgi:predicted RNA methylase
MIKLLKNIELKYTESPDIISWNSVSDPYNLWPSIYNEDEWDKYPSLKIKRLQMWDFLSKELKKLGVKEVLDIGTASGQFPLCCMLQGLKAYGIDPQPYFLYSNADDYKENGLDPQKYLFEGDIKNFINCFNESIECISLLNFFHGDDWNGRDLEFLKKINKKVKYLVISYPKNLQAKEILDTNYEIVYEYKQLERYEDHFIFKLKKK